MNTRGDLPIGIFIAALVFTFSAITLLLAVNFLPVFGRQGPIVSSVGSSLADSEYYAFSISAVNFLRLEKEGSSIGRKMDELAQACKIGGSECDALAAKMDAYADAYLKAYEKKCVAIELREPTGVMIWQGRQSEHCLFARSAFAGAKYKTEILIPTSDLSTGIVFIQKRVFG
ncbi:hypothetical protein HYY74_07810 [Candidatus Woesearchaeota archaeon]|nr:hypothetical protein [Candidatus Woesearchaeota archaeon]